MATDLSVRVDAMNYPDSAGSFRLIENLQFETCQGRIVAFLGPTGAGKTSLFRIIGGFERNYDGLVTLDGQPVLRPSRNIQLVFQDYRLLPFKTVYENLAFAIQTNGSAIDTGSVERWLRIAQLENHRDAYPKTLSGGEAGRTALARAFISPPAVLLLDEPFRNLDVASRYDLQDHLLNALQSTPATVLLISHNIEDAVFLADDIYLLSRRPMTIVQRVLVDIPRPRHRDDRRLADAAVELMRQVLACRNVM